MVHRSYNVTICIEVTFCQGYGRGKRVFPLQGKIKAYPATIIRATPVGGDFSLNWAASVHTQTRPTNCFAVPQENRPIRVLPEQVSLRRVAEASAGNLPSLRGNRARSPAAVIWLTVRLTFVRSDERQRLQFLFDTAARRPRQRMRSITRAPQAATGFSHRENRFASKTQQACLLEE